ncbi:YDG domain-containing protein [Waltera sp.]|jgi:hypothetical protein|uniref:YDG domain-containing protein n=1 Tax=Waltera sp. TaxID=2815806 RepID=UPI003991A623
MKKRVLSMLLALILCFSTLPMTAFAQEAVQEADVVTEQADPAAEQEEAEAAAAPEAETSSDKSTTVETPGTEDSTAGEAPDKSVSDSDASTQDTVADDEKKAAVQKVQALIDALPETVTEENAERVSEQLEAIDEAMAELTEEQREELDMTRLYAISEALNTPMTVPMTVAEGQHADHPICGATCTDEYSHSIVTEWKPIGSETELKAATEGHYYLTQDIETTGTWETKNNVVLCLNGHSIAANGDFGVIEIKGANRQFTLCDCNSSASTHYFSESVENNFTRWVPCEENTENCISVTGGVITHSAGTSDLGVEVDNNATFTMYGGTICGHKQPHSYYGAGVYVHDSTFNMYGGAISGNAASWCGGVAALGSTFNMHGGVISDNMVSAGGGGVLLSDKSVMNMSGNARISDNIALAESHASGGGVYIYASADGEVGNCLYMSDNAKISGNTATQGGAVYVRKNGQVTMSGNAQISNNTATENGGGVYVENSTFKIAGGAPRVCDNLCQDVQNNVYLATGNAIRISKLSTFAGKIGVSTQDTPTGSNLVTVAAAAVESGAVGSLTEEYVDHISSDKENLYPVLVNGEVKLSATVPHRHPVCGATCGDSKTHGNQTWIGVSNLTDIKSGGYYYLTDNVKLNDTWICTNDVALCLNGKTITCAAEVDAIKVAKRTTLIITDCQKVVGKITHAQDNIGRGIMSLGTLILYNGEITKNQIAKGSGAGVYVDGGNFYMYKGSISTNNAPGGQGGGVYAKDSTSFVISGGSIDSNVAKSGGGIYYEAATQTATKFTISGGNISGNSASSGGGGVCLYRAGRNTGFTMSGGSITDNTASSIGGGVYMPASYYGKFTVSGTAQITDNTKTIDKSSNNVYLPNGKPILIGANGLSSSAEIGVTMGQQLADGGQVTIAKGASNDYTLTADDLNAFSSDTGYKKYALDNAVNFSNGELHVHGICGKEGCSEAGHGNVAWIGVSKLDEITSAGYYYLKNDITLNDDWNPADGVVLCLNGNSIKAASSLKSISVNNTFTLTDCKGKDGSHYGQITNNTNIRVLQSGNFYFYGGSITGNSFNTNLSTGVIVWGNFYMHGGEIVNNTTTGKGGGVYLDKTGRFTMTGGRIANNSAKEGGGVYVDSDTITVSSAAQITGNKVVSDDRIASNNVYLPNGKKITVGGALNDSASIGVTSEAVPDDSTPVTIATAADNWINDDNFTADNSFYKVTVLDGKTATLGLHEHQWKVRVKTGSENILEEYCDVAGCTVADGTLTLEAPNQEYSGAPYNAARCTIAGNWKHTPSVGEFFYTDSTGNKINTPVNVGTYNVNVNVDGVTAKKEFTIKSGSLVFNDFTFTPPSNLTYDGQPKTATVTLAADKVNAAGAITVKYMGEDGKVIVDEDDKPVTSVTEAGTYTVGIDVAAGTGYGNQTMHSEQWTFTIGPKPVTITDISADNKVYDGTVNATITGTPAISGLVVGDENDVTVVTTSAKAAFADADAGTAKTVNFSGYALTGAKAGNYTLAQPASVTANISPKELTIADVTVAEKSYDGTMEAAVTSVTFNGLVSSESLTKDRDYTVTGNFADAAVGDNKDVTVTVNLKDSVKNYTLSDTGYTKNGCKIVKAAVADPAVRDLTIINNSTTIYTVKLRELLPSLVLPQEYGKLTYDEPQLTITDYSYQGSAVVRKGIEYGKLALQFTQTGNTEGSIGTITVTVHSDNYEDITLKFNIKATAKIVPQLEGTLKLTPSEITYGEKLSNITISSTMTAEGSEIDGTFAWNNPDAVLNAGNQQATWKFTPADTQNYAETTGTTTVRVNKAEQSGAVLMDNYTYNETPATPALTERKGDNSAVVTYYYSTTRINSSGTEWKDITSTTLKAGTYYMYAVIGETGNYKAYTTEAKAFTVWKAAPVYTKPSGLTAKYGQKLSEIALPNPAGNMPGTWSWNAPDTVIDKTGTVKYDAYFTPDDTNYKKVVGAAIEITVTPGDGRNLATEELTLAFNDGTDHTYTPDWSELPAGQTWNYECGSSIGSGSNAKFTKLNVSAADGGLTYAVSDGQVADKITVILKACCSNYKDFTITLHIQITKAAPAGEPKYTLITTGGKTLADAGLTLNGSTLNPADGTLEWVGTDGNVLSDDTEVKVNTTYKWRFTPADTNYNSLTGEIELYHVDAPAISAQPKSVSVTVGEKATFEVTATGTDVTYQWKIDRNDGNGFVDITGATGAAYTTGVTDKDCDGFKYQCVIRNAAGSATTDTVVLTVLYQIIEGANGSWNQSTDGESLRIRGNGEYSKFQNVKVDGNIIDSKNYTVSEGSTIIELHADYLKTLSEGSHTFEIVWTDGAAGTGFTVARNTSGSNSTGSNNTGNNDNNDSTDNSAAAAPTAAATAQELDKVPATGDPHGIWLMLFAISLTGLAGMLARRKKN